MWSINNIVSQGESAKRLFAASVFSKEEDESSSTDAAANANNSEKTAGSSSNPNPTLSVSSPAPTIAALPPKKSPTKDQPNTNSIGFLSNIKDNLSKPESKEMFNSIKSSWGNVVTATREVTKQAVETIEKEQTRIQASLFKNGPYKRDISQSLDTESLRDAEVVYITDRIITMSHPAMQSAVDGNITPDRKLAAIAHLLQKRHGGRYMVWNLSEMEYDYSVLDDQVMTFEFPGSPSPPLGLLMKILLGIESWLKADERNVAVMHCLTGRGRTSTVMAAFLCWMGEAGFSTPNKALEYMSQCKKLDLETLTIPSQRRYVSYFTNMLDGIRPSQPPLLLKRILMSEAPKFEKYHLTKSGDVDDVPKNEDDQREGQLGCAPYLQIFKGGKLVFTTAASKAFNQGPDDLPFCFPSEGSITFPVETVLQGDILIRCRHLTRKGQRVSMFRAAMHTGYIPPKVMRLRKSDIDGACNDKRYGKDFFIDLVFEECAASMASKHLLSSPDNEGGEMDMQIRHETKDNIQNEASKRRMMGTIAGSEEGAVTVTASAYDSMLHRDSRFWDVIGERRNKKAEVTTQEGEKISHAFYGPTIGRRREFTDEKVTSTSSKDGSGSVDLSVSSQKSSIAMQSFTIGGELDFTVDGAKDNSSEDVAPAEAKKDDLMDALMAIDDDDDDEDNDDGDESGDTDNEIIQVKPSAPITPDVVQAHLENADTSTEEIVFEEETALESNESKTDKEGDTSGPTAPIASQPDKPKQSDAMNFEELNLEDEVGDLDINLDNDNEDEYNFDGNDDDDDDLQDLEDLEAFLTKATV